MKFSIAALALVLSLAVAAPAPELIDRDATAIADSVISMLVERGMLEARACSGNSVCSQGKCYSVFCIGNGPNNCSRNPTGKTC
jgi:predicted solute-binding protein